MIRTRRLTNVITWTMACSFGLPHFAQASEPPRAVKPSTVRAMPKPIDVKLRAGGELSAVVHNPAGKPQPGAMVAVLHEGTEVALVKTDANGRFAVGGLRRGNHIVQVQNLSNPVRLWPENAAPPQAIANPVITLEPGSEEALEGEGVYEPEVIEVQQNYRPAPRRPGPLRRLRAGIGRVFANYPILATTALIGAGIGSGIAIGSNNSPASP
jgi:hypothetical protein